MYCKNCGKEIADESQFCKYCGVKFNKKTTINGKTIVTEVDNRKEKNVNSVISLLFAIGSFVCCLLPLSFGFVILVAVVMLALISLFFRLRAKDEMYKLYDSKGKLVGKKLISASLMLSLISIMLAIGSILRFI